MQKFPYTIVLCTENNTIYCFNILTLYCHYSIRIFHCSLISSIWLSCLRISLFLVQAWTNRTVWRSLLLEFVARVYQVSIDGETATIDCRCYHSQDAFCFVGWACCCFRTIRRFTLLKFVVRAYWVCSYG